MPKTKLVLLLLMVGPAVPLGDAQAPAAAETYTPTLTFDIASIRESAGVTGGGLKVGITSPPNSSRFEAVNFTTKSLLQTAYASGAPVSVLGGPDWLGSVFYNVQAKSDAAVDEQLAKMPLNQERLEKQHMLQALLTERFHLKFHMEDKETSVFALVPAKGGPKLQAIGVDPNAPAPSSQGNDVQAHGAAQGLEFVAKSFSPAALTGLLASQLKTPVIDRSGLTGYFAFTLQIGAEWSANNPQGWPDIETAVQEQLGLKLERTKAVIPVMVIDHIERPTAN